MIEGLFVPQFTVFNKDQKVDYVATKEHGAWLLSHGVTGLVPFGTFGEGSSLSLAEKKRVTTDLLNVINGKMLIPTIISNSLAEIQEYLEFAEELPIAGVMVSPPSYYRPVTDENLIEFYRLIARKTTHPTFDPAQNTLNPLTGKQCDPAVHRTLHAQPPGQLCNACGQPQRLCHCPRAA